jgi:cytochrome c-type biogenesis protein CcmE
MKSFSNSLRIGIAVAVIVGTIGWLAYSGYGSSKSYYVKLPELISMGDKAYSANLRVEGFVKPGSIQQSGTNVTFVLDEFESHSKQAGAGRTLTVSYKGSEPPPDTFKDDAQALAMGTLGHDGIFHANQLQAKCASKYAPSQPGPSGTPSSTPPAATAPASPAKAAVTN